MCAVVSEAGGGRDVEEGMQILQSNTECWLNAAVVFLHFRELARRICVLTACVPSTSCSFSVGHSESVCTVWFDLRGLRLDLVVSAVLLTSDHSTL